MTENYLKDILKKEGIYKAFEYKGYKCRIIRMGIFELGIFHLCWYVLLTEKDKWYKKDWMDLPYTVHGGLTYSNSYLRYQPEKDWWRIGFDCNHAGDLSMDYQLNKECMLWINATYKTMEFVENELKQLVDQIVSDREK